MKEWVITVPQHIDWAEYEKELKQVEDRSHVMRYKVGTFYNIHRLDRVYVCYQGKVRGWMEVVEDLKFQPGFTCSTTGKQWPGGFYIVRSGPFHKVDGPEMKGFRGVRKFPQLARLLSETTNHTT